MMNLFGCKVSILTGDLLLLQTYFFSLSFEVFPNSLHLVQNDRMKRNDGMIMI